MELSREEELQAYSDALGAIVTAIARQIDAPAFVAELQRLANIADTRGHGPSAGLIDEMARVVQTQVIGQQKH